MRPYSNKYNALQNLFNEFMHIEDERLTYQQLKTHQECAKEMVELIEMFHADYGNIIASSEIEETFEKQLEVILDKFYFFNDTILIKTSEDGDWEIDINFTPKFRKVIERISDLFFIFEDSDVMVRHNFMSLAEIL